MTALPVAVDGASASAVDAKPKKGSRVDSVDAVRGFVMILMAIDHARDFVGRPVSFHGIDVEKIGAALFFTRWITHFCAPVFILLAGTGAYLQIAAGKSRRELSRFLVTRGLWLVALEVTVIRLGWTFDPGYHVTPLQVIWAIGWCMVALAGLVFLPVRVVGAIGVLIIAGHHLLDGIAPARFGSLAFVWSMLHAPGFYSFAEGHGVFVVYPLIPWIGVMAAGYALGAAFEGEASERRTRLLRLGAACCLGFLLVRGVNVYGDADTWSQKSSVFYTALDFLNCTKYPPSLSFLLMTIGPSLCALGALEGRDFAGKRALLVFGRAPLFYYILHLYLLHAAAAVVYFATYGSQVLEWGKTLTLPPDAAFGLPFVYGFTAAGVLALYPLCRWFADLKRRRRDLAWLSYL